MQISAAGARAEAVLGQQVHNLAFPRGIPQQVGRQVLLVQEGIRLQLPIGEHHTGRDAAALRIQVDSGLERVFEQAVLQILLHHYRVGALQKGQQFRKHARRLGTGEGNDKLLVFSGMRQGAQELGV